MMILSREVRSRIKEAKEPQGAEWSDRTNGTLFYYKKCSIWPWLNEYWSYVHNKWILIT